MKGIRQAKRLCNSRNRHMETHASVDAAFVGLSFKEGMAALDSRSKSGAIIDEIVNGLCGFDCWRTNLVDKILVDEDGRPRGPTTTEVSRCFRRFEERIRKHQPRVVVMLGALASKHVLNRMAGASFPGWSGSLNYEPVMREGTAYIAAHHPSHIAVYRRRERDEYVTSLRSTIVGVLSRCECENSTPNRKNAHPIA